MNKNYFFIFSFVAVFLFSSCKDDILVSPNEQNVATRAGIASVVTTTSLQTQMIENVAHTDYQLNDVSAGSYYLSAWVEIPMINGSLPEYQIKINGLLSENTFKPTEPGFQTLLLTDHNYDPAFIPLANGDNIITLVSVGREILNVGELKVSGNLKDAEIDDSAYKNFINELQSGNIVSQNMDANNLVALATLSDEIYDYALNVRTNYTYEQTIYMEKQRVKITTSGAAIPHVIELYRTSINNANPDTYSFAASGTTSATLDVTLPDWWGDYRLRIRALNDGQTGTLNFNYWENWEGFVTSRDYTNVPVAGAVIPVNRTLSTNYFLAQSTNPVQTLMTLYTQNPGKVIMTGMNTVGGYWFDGYASYSNRVTNLVAVNTLNNLSGTVDAYMGLSSPSASLFSGFPNLSRTTTFKSGEVTAGPPYGYNCISWTIERTDYWEWPGDEGSNYYDKDILKAFDKLYTAYGYTRTGATADNAGIALWGTSASNLTHASIRKNANTRKPHGYAWESKCGANQRVMHERDGVRGSTYGNILHYYKPTGTRSAVQSNIVEEKIDLTSIKNQTNAFSKSIPSEKISEFENKYAAWIKTWEDPKVNLHSNPKKYAESVEYDDLLKFCQDYGKASWPLFIEKFVNGDIFAINLIRDLTYAENEDLLESVKNKAIKSRSANVPLPSLYQNCINYCSELLNIKKAEIQSSILLKN